MKVEVTHASIVNDMGVVATVQLVDENVVQINIKQVTGWNDWIEVYEAIKKIMLMMGVKND
jgi:hypothetical protein